ncbi:MAG: AraC family transcriptional regulator [Croceibacterium sp.]
MKMAVGRADGLTITSSTMTPMQLANRPQGGPPLFYVYMAEQRTAVRANGGPRLVINPDELLITRSDQSTDWEIPSVTNNTALAFEDHLFREYFPDADELVGRNFRLPGSMPSLLRDIVNSAWSLNCGDAFPDQGKRMGRAFLDMLSIGLENAARTCSKRAESTVRQYRLDQIKSHIASNFGDPDLNVGNLSQRLGLSTRYLQMAFAEESATPSSYIWNTRLKAAAKLLRMKGEDISITEIAFRCGFNSSSHFSTLFKDVYGTTPREYRTSDP